MNALKQWKNEKKALRMADALKERGFNVQIAKDLDEAKKMALALVPEGSSVAVGGSVTLEEMDMVKTLREGPYKFFDRYQDLPFMPDIVELHRKSLTADVFLTSVNAVTENGELVLSDATGNRVAALSFGARKAVVIVGVNKLVKNLDDAFERIREIEPLNAKRNSHKTQSAETGFYSEEYNAQRMLNITGVIHYGGKFDDRLHVIVVEREAGF